MGGHCVLAEGSARHAIAKRVRALRAEVKPATAEDPDGIHDLRVASRRLRVAVAEHANLFAKPSRKSLQRRLRRVTRLLGKARELDVTLGLLGKWRGELHGAPRYAAAYVTGRLRAERKAQSEVIADAVEGFKGETFNERLVGLFEGMTGSKKCYVKKAARRLKARYRDATEQYGVWVKSGSAPDLHGLRIAFKKLRYACEVYEPLYGPEMGALIERLKEAQTVLGDWNDCRVLLDYVGKSVEQAPPRAAAGIPGLEETLGKHLQRLLEAFEAAAAQLFSPAARAETMKAFGNQREPCCQKGARLPGQAAP